MKKVSGDSEQQKIPSTFRERMIFVVWLSAKVLGTDSSAQFARAIGKGASQLSKWTNENPRPEWGSIKRIADAINQGGFHLDPLWLDDPAQHGAQEPADFDQWLKARRAREAADAKPRRARRS